MNEKRCYPLSREYLLNLISDIIELQNGRDVQADSTRGVVRFTNRMYGFRHEYAITLFSGDGLCCVAIETDGARGGDKERLRQMFALLESMMPQTDVGTGRG